MAGIEGVRFRVGDIEGLCWWQVTGARRASMPVVASTSCLFFPNLFRPCLLFLSIDAEAVCSAPSGNLPPPRQPNLDLHTPFVLERSGVVLGVNMHLSKTKTKMLSLSVSSDSESTNTRAHAAEHGCGRLGNSCRSYWFDIFNNCHALRAAFPKMKTCSESFYGRDMPALRYHQPHFGMRKPRL